MSLLPSLQARATPCRRLVQLVALLSLAGTSVVALSSPPTTSSSSTATRTTTTASRRAFVRDVAAVAGGCVAGTAAAGGGGGAVAPASATGTESLPLMDTKAPYFELPNSRGEGTTTLSTLVQSGKWTVLYFYPGAFTKGCTLEARNFQRDYDKYKALNAQIVGVSVDPVEKNAQFCSTEGLDFYMLSDTGGRVSQMYGSAISVPGFGTFSNRQTYVIDPSGELRYVFTDVESRISRHSSEVLAKLGDLINGPPATA